MCGFRTIWTFELVRPTPYLMVCTLMRVRVHVFLRRLNHDLTRCDFVQEQEEHWLVQVDPGKSTTVIVLTTRLTEDQRLVQPVVLLSLHGSIAHTGTQLSIRPMITAYSPHTAKS